MTVWIVKSYSWDAGTIEGVFASEVSARTWVDAHAPGDDWRERTKVTENRTYAILPHEVQPEADDDIEPHTTPELSADMALARAAFEAGEENAAGAAAWGAQWPGGFDEWYAATLGGEGRAGTSVAEDGPVQ